MCNLSDPLVLHTTLKHLSLVCRLGGRGAGAVGSRLTGAGWGGCAVSMVPSDRVESFIRAVSEAYYAPDSQRAAMEKQSLFVSKPGGGATVFIKE